MNYLPCEIIETDNNVDASVIWLHGLGANGHDFVPIVPELQLPDDLKIRFIFPHAPSIPVTINGGMTMPAWYDILAMTTEREFNHDQLLDSSKAVITLIEREIEQGIESSRIVLAGFSQGGAVAYQTALAYDKPIAGLMAMSTYFATHQTIKVHPNNSKLPIHVFHGQHDPVVPEMMGQQALKYLQDFGFQPVYKSYPMEHAVHPAEIKDISIFLQKVLS